MPRRRPSRTQNWSACMYAHARMGAHLNGMRAIRSRPADRPTDEGACVPAPSSTLAGNRMGGEVLPLGSGKSGPRSTHSRDPLVKGTADITMPAIPCHD